MNVASIRFWIALLLVTVPSLSRAMSVLPPTFNELIDESSRIVRGTVVSVTPFETTLANGDPVVKTRVTWKLESTLKGQPSSGMTLEFLGGSLPHLAVDVPGMPRFEVGDSDYLFLGKNEKALCPVIAGEHGRYCIEYDSGSGVPRVRHAPKPKGTPGSAAIRSALSTEGGDAPQDVAGFEAAVRNRLQKGTAP